MGWEATGPAWVAEAMVAQAMAAAAAAVVTATEVVRAAVAATSLTRGQFLAHAPVGCCKLGVIVKAACHILAASCTPVTIVFMESV
jgi:hypothetical protein